MISFGNRRIFIANEPVDMRKSFDTLATYVECILKKSPLYGDAFVFIGKRYNRLKVLIWEDSGFWLLSKRLSQGTFKFKHDKNNNYTSLSPAQWHMLLEGIIIKKSRTLKRFNRKKTL